MSSPQIEKAVDTAHGLDRRSSARNRGPDVRPRTTAADSGQRVEGRTTPAG